MLACPQQSDLGAVGAWRRRRGRERVRWAEVAQWRGALWVGGQWEGGGRVLVVGVEPQPLPAVAHVVCEARAVGVRRAGGAVVVVGARVQLVQGDGVDGHAIHGEGVAGVAGEVGERVCSHRRAHIHLRTILLTAVILQRDSRKMPGKRDDEKTT